MRANGKDVSNLYEAAMEVITEAVLITEAELQSPGPFIVYANPAFEVMTGYSTDELIGMTPRILQGPATDPVVLAKLRTELETHATFQGESVNYRKDGAPFLVEWLISAIRNEAGGVAYWVAAQRDITKLRASADHQRAVHADLLGRIKQTTKAIERLLIPPAK